MSQDLIKDVIAPEFNKQVNDAKSDLKKLNDQFIDTLKSALLLRDATAGSTTFADLTKNVNAASQAHKKLKDDTEDQAKAAAKLQAAEEKRLNAYLVGLSKEQAARDAADAKEMAANQKRLDAIAKEQAALEAAAEKRRAILNSTDERFNRPTYQDSPVFQVGGGTLTDAEVAAINAKREALLQEAAALRGVIEVQATATAAKQKAATVDSQENSILMEAINDNIRLKVELKQVELQIKNTASADAGLIAEQARLKAAISQNTAIIGQAVKQDIAASGSADQLNARLAQLRSGYNALSKEERDNIEIGGKYLAEIKVLDKQTKEIAESQGLYNKSVGDYENKIKSAISQYVPFGQQLVSGIDTLKNVNKAQSDSASGLAKLGLGFASFTIGAFAIGLAAAASYLNEFQNAQDRVDVGLAGLKARFNSIGQIVADSLTPKNDKPTILSQIVDFAGYATTYLNPSVLAAKYLGDQFIKVTDATAKAAEAAVIAEKKYEDLNTTISLQDKLLQGQVASLRAQARDKSNGIEQQIALLDKAAEKEREIVKGQERLGEEAVKVAIQAGNIYSKLSASDIDRLNKGDIALAASLNRQGKITKDGYELYVQALNKRTDALNTSVATEDRIRSLRNNLEMKGDKKAADDALKQQIDSYNRRIQAAKDAAAIQKSIQADDNNPEGVRYAALQALLAKEDEIADLEAGKAKLHSKNLGDIEKARLAQRALNRQQYNVEYEKIITDEQKKEQILIDAAFKVYQEKYQAYTDSQLQELASNYSEQERVLADNYANGTINEAQYQKGKLDLQRSYNNLTNLENQRALELKLVQEAVAGKDITATLKALGILKVKINKDANDQEIADDLKKANEDAKIRQKRKELELAAVDLLKTVGDAQFQKQLDNIQAQSDAIDKLTKSQIDAEERSLDSTKTKADKEAVINAQATAQKEVLAKQEKRIKHDQAVYDKELAIAKIIISTAEAVAANLEVPFLAALIAALGAVELGIAIAQPIPEFYKGGIMGYDGKAKFGELGRELRIEPDGEVSLTPGTTTIGSVRKGTRFIDAETTTRILTRPESIKYVGGEQISMREVERLLKKVAANTESRPQRTIGNRNPAHWNTDYFRSKIN